MSNLSLTPAPVRILAAGVMMALLLAACAPTPEGPGPAAAARAELTRLQSDPELASLVPAELRDAEAAVQLAEQQDVEADVAAHRLYVANRRIEIARALAEARHAEKEREELVALRDRTRLEARTREAAIATTEAQIARAEADAARMQAADAQQQTAELQRELDELNARSTDRGLVLTLGDVLFESGRSELKAGSVMNLDQLVAFLQKYPERTVLIEGHTDSVGDENYNLDLSQRRADAVKAYLLRRGIDPTRITSTGLGESAPVASNSSDAGRLQNRRVEIVITNPAMAAR